MVGGGLGAAGGGPLEGPQAEDKDREEMSKSRAPKVALEKRRRRAEDELRMGRGGAEEELKRSPLSGLSRVAPRGTVFGHLFARGRALCFLISLFSLLLSAFCLALCLSDCIQSAVCPPQFAFGQPQTVVLCCGRRVSAGEHQSNCSARTMVFGARLGKVCFSQTAALKPLACSPIGARPLIGACASLARKSRPQVLPASLDP